MLRDQVINFLEATIVFLLLTNAISVLTAAYAIAVASGAHRRIGEIKNAITHSPGGLLSAVRPANWPMRR